MVIYHFWVSIFKDRPNEDWLLVLKNNARRGFSALESNGKNFLARGMKKKLNHLFLDRCTLFPVQQRCLNIRETRIGVLSSPHWIETRCR
jgi:hypothetical protein